MLAEGDTQIQTALGLFGKAADMLAQRRNVPPTIERAETEPKGKM